MRELTMTETEAAAGGVLLALLAGFASGLAAAYAYEKIGGAEGIERAVKAVGQAIVDAGETRAKLCQDHPTACVPVGF